MAEATGRLEEPEYVAAKETARLAGVGIDSILALHDLDALVAPTTSPAWAIDPVVGDHYLGASSSPAAVAGYPNITVPMGFIHELPVGISFFGAAFSEPTLLGIAFGYEQNHRIDEAEAAAHQALRIDANEPWAHHALAHSHLSRGTIGDGLSILLESSPSWSGLNSFMFTHNWWHVALFEIAGGAVERALQIYDERCWGVEPDYSQDQIGAISLLARLELAGVDVGDRWMQLLPYIESRCNDVVQPFMTLQYLYGLARTNDSLADELLALIEAQAGEPVVPGDRRLWQDVGIPAARGLVAYARNRHELAARDLGSVRSRLWQTGGSHAQRDLFEQILLDARMRSGQWQLALKTLQQRRQWEPDSPILEQRLNEVYRQLGPR